MPTATATQGRKPSGQVLKSPLAAPSSWARHTGRTRPPCRDQARAAARPVEADLAARPTARPFTRRPAPRDLEHSMAKRDAGCRPAASLSGRAAVSAASYRDEPAESWLTVNQAFAV